MPGPRAFVPGLLVLPTFARSQAQARMPENGSWAAVRGRIIGTTPEGSTTSAPIEVKISEHV